MAERLCRNHLHPLAGNRGRKASGGTFCVPCEQVAQQASKSRRLVGLRDGWADPIADAERRERLTVWQAGVDAAIAEMRRTEGFDGATRTWTTLGECLLPERRRRGPSPTVIAERRIVACARCQTPRWANVGCASCAAGLRARRAS